MRHRRNNSGRSNIVKRKTESTTITQWTRPYLQSAAPCNVLTFLATASASTDVLETTPLNAYKVSSTV